MRLELSRAVARFLESLAGRYLVALALVALAFALRSALTQQVGWREPFAFFYMAIFASAWLGGLGPGVVASAAALPLAMFGFIRPLGALEVRFPHDWSALALFLLVGLVLSAAGASARHARKELRRQRDWSDRVLSGVADGVIVTDAGDRVVYMNPEAERLTGWPLADARGGRLAGMLDLAPTGARDTSHTLISRQGMRTSVLHSERGPLALGPGTGHIHGLHDIQELSEARDALDRSERKLASLLSSDLLGIFFVDDHGRITFANRAFETMVQRDAASLARLSSGWQSLCVDDTGHGAHARCVDQLRLHGACPAFDVEVLRGDGRRRWLTLGAQRIHHDELAFFAIDAHDKRQSLARLRRRERDLRLVMESSSARLTYVDREGVVLWANRMAGAWLGMTESDLQGRRLDEVMEGASAATLRRNLEKAAQGEAVEFEWAHEHPDLGLAWSRSTITPDLDAQNVVVGYMLLCIDITERRAMEEALRRSELKFRSLIELVPHMMWIADAQGRPEFFNRHWFQYTALAPGSPWESAVHPDDLDRLRLGWQSGAGTGEGMTVEVRCRRAQDGAWRWHVLRSVPLVSRDGSVSRWYGSFTDIDDQKRAQAVLLQAAGRTREFIGMLGHELRNPLAAIRAATAVLHASDDGSSRTLAVDMVGRQVDLMRRLVDDLLESARVSNDRIELRYSVVELDALLRQTLADHDGQFEGAGLRYRYTPHPHPVHLRVDELRIRQCLGNLLTNARNASRNGEEIEVGVDLEVPGDGIVIHVRDRGVGIDPELLDSIFEPFVQGTSVTGRLGIGLSLVRKLVRLHGGEVRACSDGPGQGARFSLHLPASCLVSAPAAVPVPDEGSRPMQRGRVVVIDDERDNAEALRLYLQVMGHEVEVAFDAETGLATVLRVQPDVVICDLGLPPPVDGLALARRIQALPGSPPYLVAYSGYGQAEDLERSRRAGFQRHIVKPAAPEQLHRVICEGLVQRQERPAEPQQAPRARRGGST